VVPARLFGALGAGSRRNLADTLRSERAGGVLLLAGTVVALAWANLWPTSYDRVSDAELGPAALGLHLSVHAWASDGLLAVFFFVVGLELARELTEGELRHVATAVVPAVAAVGGMFVPALLYLAVNLTSAGGEPRGWAVPTATDIAFAVSVLALVGRSLPDALRAFLLTLAVVDDLLAIVVIGVVYTERVQLGWLAAGAAAVVVFAVLVRRGVRTGFVLVPLGVAAWACVHASGVHATIAGVALGLVTPVTGPHAAAERWERRWRPVSAGFAVPVFALFAAGVTLDAGTFGAALHDPVARGVTLGLVVGKPLGILGATWLVARFTRARLAPTLRWADVAAVGLVGGIGFTVSLLVGELAFGEGSAHDEHVVVAVLVGSALAALLGGVALRWRDRRHVALAGPSAGTTG
jgi:NhaA family Na+:H+ antiporter